MNHQDSQPSTTISFNLAPGKSLSDATKAVNDAQRAIGMPVGLHGAFQGTAKVFQESLANEPMLILAAIVAIYLVLGVLYESYVHPLTVLSTLPSAGVGAVIALIVLHIEFTIIALIGVILLIGIVKKNAILMIDFALAAERDQGLSARELDPPGGAHAVPPDHDDHLRRHPRRGAPGHRRRARDPSFASRSAWPSSAGSW